MAVAFPLRMQIQRRKNMKAEKFVGMENREPADRSLSPVVIDVINKCSPIVALFSQIS
jgi:hypothetical protein